MADPLTPDEISRRVAALIANLQDELRRIDEKAGAERRAAIAASGLPAELVETVLGKSPLTPKEPYATIPPMSTTFVSIPRKTGRPLGDGPVAIEAKRLGMSMDGVARAIGFSRNTVKTWNARGKIPPDAQAKIDALKPAKPRRATSAK